MPDSTAVIEGRFYQSQVPGVVQVIREKFVATAALAANSVIRMVPVKKGAKILDVKIKFTAFGAGRTVNVGDGADVDRFLAAGSVAAAGVLPCSAATGFFYEYTVDDTIDVVVLVDTMPIGAEIEVVVTYVMVQ